MKSLLGLHDDKTLLDMGVGDWGYSEDPIPISFQHYAQWVQQSHHEPLGYLSDERFEKRKNLKNIYPSYQSALVFLFSYTDMADKYSSGRVASYAYAFEGRDYHLVLKDKLQSIGETLRDYCNTEFKVSVDTDAILERDLAYRCGLGWFGKNSMLIHPRLGSFFLIGSLLLSKKLPIQQNLNLVPDYCGSCQLCSTHCPTDAIDIVTRTLNAKKCISTFTIEAFKEDTMAIPAGYPTINEEIFGCDICQQVCPWNRKPLKLQGKIQCDESSSHPFLELLHSGSLELIFSQVSQMSNREYLRLTQGTSLFRTGKKGLLKNLKPYLKR